MQELLTFDDVLIVPKFSTIESRSQVSLATNIRELHFNLPLISANMDTVTGRSMAATMQLLGAQACLHRFGTIQETVEDFKYAYTGCVDRKLDGPMVSIGLGPNELERAKALFQAGAHTFVIDVAHGAQLSVAKQAKALREEFGPGVNIVVGNFATGDSVAQFLDYAWNCVDAVKVGIGPGSACTTRIKTGVGIPQLSAVMDVVRILKNTDIKVIADGGMKKPADIAKALGAGAHAVMLGGMLAGTKETPGLGEKAGPDGNFKLYRGSASLESYKDQGKEAKHRTAEGEAFWVPCKGPVEGILQDIEGGLRSAMSYVGARTLREFHKKCEFVRITPSTISENGAHGKR